MMASSEGDVLLPPCFAPLRNGGYRLYKPEPFKGVVRRAKKTAAHVYYGFFNPKFGNLKVHRLVCEAFHGPPPFDRAVVIHIDENALNNRPENLKWGTQKENLNAPGFREQCRQRRAERSPRAIWKARQEEAA